MAAKWTVGEYEGWTAWYGESAGIKLCVIPELGSKAVMLLNKATGREWLWKSGKPLGHGGYASGFGDGDESGWDEMFPGINACVYPEGPWKGAPIPDHGEVWSLPWSGWLTEEGKLACAVAGVTLPYKLTKTYTFVGSDTLRIDYEVANEADHPLAFLWAAHMLLQAEAGMKLRVPAGLAEMEVSYSHGERLGAFGDKQAWPLARAEDGGEVDLGTVEPAAAGTAEKYYYTGRVPAGWATLENPATGESITLRYPPEQVPYLAIWANSGGYGGHAHYAIEPATGRMDDLSHAMRNHEVAIVPGHGVYRWYLEVQLA